MKFLYKGGVIFDNICSVLAAIAAGIVGFMALLISSDVFMRYVLASPQPFVQEVVEFSIVHITFMGAAWVLIREGHVKMDMVLNHLGSRSQSMLIVITSVCGAIACFIVAWYGALLVWDLFKAGIHEATVLDPPKWLILLIVPVGNFLLFIQFLRRARQNLVNWKAL